MTHNRWSSGWKNVTGAQAMLIVFALGVVVSLIGWAWKEFSLKSDERPSQYALRVQVFDSSGNFLPDANVEASAANEVQFLEEKGYWEIEVTEHKLPLDGMVWVDVHHAEWSATKEQIKLGDDPNPPPVRIVLDWPSTHLGGWVEDGDGRLLPGVPVSVLGVSPSSPDPQTTRSDGRFAFELAVAPDQYPVHVSHPDFGGELREVVASGDAKQIEALCGEESKARIIVIVEAVPSAETAAERDPVTVVY